MLESATIASRLPEHTDPSALVVGPTGVGLDRDGTLFVADSVGNRIAKIPGAPWADSDAGPGRTVSTGGALNTPLGLIVAPNGDVLTVNGGDDLVETTPHGHQVATQQLDGSGSPAGAGRCSEAPGAGTAGDLLRGRRHEQARPAVGTLKGN